jgi:hypothetical protein
MRNMLDIHPLFHRYHAYRDPDFVKAVEAAERSGNKTEYIDISNFFELSVAGVKYFAKMPRMVALDEIKDDLELPGGIGAMHKENGGLLLTVDLEASLTKRDFLVMQKWIRRYQKEHSIVTRYKKSPQDTQLLYAIWKQRRNGLTFSTIFDMYRSGTLPLYSKSTSQYDTKDDLKHYYSIYYKV